VLKSNYREIKKFVELGLDFECDKIIFQKNFSLTNTKENINLTHDKKVMIEIAQMLKDPIFEKWQVDTTLIDEYRNYISLKSNLFDRILSKLKVKILHYPLLSVYSILKFAPFLIDFSEFYKNNIKPALYINKAPKQRFK
jgi:hypothetical protein